MYHIQHCQLQQPTWTHVIAIKGCQPERCGHKRISFSITRYLWMIKVDSETKLKPNHQPSAQWEIEATNGKGYQYDHVGSWQFGKPPKLLQQGMCTRLIISHFSQRMQSTPYRVKMCECYKVPFNVQTVPHTLKTVHSWTHQMWRRSTDQTTGATASILHKCCATSCQQVDKTHLTMWWNLHGITQVKSKTNTGQSQRPKKCILAETTTLRTNATQTFNPTASSPTVTV